jgi:2-dehydro-3-deoxyglucarate aldolase/4-hydroxy-2-oxoheptanedioate aldolase
MTKSKKTESLGQGTWITIGSPVITELISSYPFDWLLFDMEHGYLTEDSLLGNMQAVRQNEMKQIVRVPCLDPALIARVLDRGAAGIMVPHISSPEQATACVDAICYPPHGKRGYSSQVRSFKYGLKKSADIESLHAPFLIVQIEDYEGIMNAEAIARVDGVDVLFIGASDLKLDLSTRTGSTIAFTEAVKIVADAAIKNRKQAGILLKNVGDIPEYTPLGFTCFAVNSDLGILRKGYQTLITQLKNL